MGSLFCVTALLLGIDVGWRPLPDAEGGFEYIIQIEPELLGAIDDREGITSDVPPGLDIRSYRVVVGRGAVPRTGAPAEEPDTASAEQPPVLPVPVAEQEELADTSHAPAESQASPLGQTGSSPVTQILHKPPIELPASSRPKIRFVAQAEKPSGQTTPQPWSGMLATLVALLASGGLNVYLFWLVRGFRVRYRQLLTHLKHNPGGSAEA